MITCKRCGKENQDHYKFCLGCGSELSNAPAAGGGQPQQQGGVAMMKTVMADMGSQSSQRPASPTPPGGVRPGSNLPGMGPGGPPQQAPQPQAPPQGGAPAPQPGPPPAQAPQPAQAPAQAPQPAQAPAQAPQQGAAPGPRRCSNCGADVPQGFAFCGQCGTKIEAAPAQPRSTADLAQQPQTDTRPRAKLVLIRPDGSEGGTHEVDEGENELGRDHGSVFENDGYLSPTHAELVINAAGAVIHDADSLNGVFVRMTEEEEITPGQIIRIGQELLRFDLIEPPAPTDDGTEIMGSPNPGYWGKLSVIIGEDVDGSAFPLLGDSVTVGRERGDINFPDDGYVSGLHARISTRDGKVYLADLGSSNGTFIKVNGQREVTDGSFILLGQQLFKVVLRT